MKPRILFAIAMALPAIAIACGSAGKETSRIAPPVNPAYAAAHQSDRKVADDGIVSPPGERQSKDESVACCRNATCDDQGRIVRKSNGSGGFIDYIYHPRTGKLILVLDGGYQTAFHYNDEGELSHASNSDGKLVTFDYAGTSKIQRFVEIDRSAGTRRELTFKYNGAGKPVEISLVGVGKIKVDYDDKGEITKVNSKQGMQMALQVTQAFQNLLSIVQPTGTRF